MSLTWGLFIDRCVGGRRMRPELLAAGWTVTLHDERFAQDARDADWLPVVAAEGLVIVTRDKRMRRREDELVAMLRSRARVVFVGFDGNLHQYVSALLAAEERLQRLLDGYAPPLALTLHRDGRVDRVHLREVVGGEE